MRNITDLKWSTCQTPCGGDYTTCCFCGGYYFDYFYHTGKHDLDQLSDSDMRSVMYCNKCRVLYEAGCEYTESIYNGHVVGKWRNKITGEVFDGMPQFDDTDDWWNHVNDIEIIKWQCTRCDVS